VSRFPAAAFTALALATVGAFFVTQHLKVTTPLIAGAPQPVPGVINPYGASCGGVNHSRTRLSFYLLHRSDTVAVYIVDSSGAILRTVASSRHMRRGVRNPDGDFSWDGRENNARIAPDGTYYIRVAMLKQGRTVELTDSAGRLISVEVKTIPPHPVVTDVSPSLIPQGNGTKVAIDYTGNEQRSGMIRLYRTDLPGGPRLVKSFRTAWGSGHAIWDGLIHGLPAPAGTYLVGLDVTDAACNTGHFPALLPPTPGSTPHAGVSVRYLAAEPPRTQVPAGSRAVVYVDARRQPFTWALWRVGARRPSAHGAQGQFGQGIEVKLPLAQGAGLYRVAIDSGAHRTEVPLVVGHPGTAHAPPILVVLPALTWQGENPVDETGDGIPNTLDNGGPVSLTRVLANGLPADYPDLAALLSYLDRAHLPYDLTTDIALAEGVGPALTGHAGVVLAGTERWTTPRLAAALRSYVQSGGRLLSLGVSSLLRYVTISNGSAVDPRPPVSTDALGGRPAPPVTNNRDLITVIRDGLGIFAGTSGVFAGYSSFQPIAVASPGEVLSEAGTTSAEPSIVGYRLGRGTVIDVGPVGFARSLASNVDAKAFLGRLWKILSR
jgi:hypothetical protein